MHATRIQKLFFNILLGTGMLCAALDKCGAQPVWSWISGGGGTNADVVVGLQLDNASNVYVAGVFGGSYATFGTNQLAGVGTGPNGTAFLNKYDASGKLQWARAAGVALGSSPWGPSVKLAIDNGGNTILARSSLSNDGSWTASITRFDPFGSGTEIFRSTGIPSTIWLTSLAMETNGNIVIGGGAGVSGSVPWGTSTISGTNGYTTFVAKHKPTGEVLWTRSASTGNFSQGQSLVAVNSSGDVFVAGKLDASVVFGTFVVPYPQHSPTLPGPLDYFIVRIDKNGNYVWATHASSSSVTPRAIVALALDLNGDVIALETTGLAKFSGADGGSTWVKSISGNASALDPTLPVAVDTKGNIHIAGPFKDNATFGASVVAGTGSSIIEAVFDDTGTLIDAIRKPSNGISTTVRGLAIDANGDSFLAGMFQGVESFDSFGLSSTGLSDVFVGKLSAAPFIFTQPSKQIVLVGHPAVLTVIVGGPGPFTYQWQKGQVSIPGATNDTLILPSVEASDAGLYRVLVSNIRGTAISDEAALLVDLEGLDIALYAGMKVIGSIGKTYTIQSTTDFEHPNWKTLTNLTLTATNQFWLDPSPATGVRRFYRSIQQP